MCVCNIDTYIYLYNLIYIKIEILMWRCVYMCVCVMYSCSA